MNRGRLRVSIIGAVLVLAIVALVGWRASSFEAIKRETEDTSIAGGDRNEGPPAASPGERSPNVPKRKDELTPPDDPLIKSLTDQLKKLEDARTTFCRSIEKPDETIHEFVVTRPSEAEVEKIKRLISQANGLTRDDNGKIVTWRERLISEYLPDPVFEHSIVSVTYNPKADHGNYSVIGVRAGNLTMRGGNAPAPTDGSINFLAGNVIFDYGTSWRYSHLFEKDER